MLGSVMLTYFPLSHMAAEVKCPIFIPFFLISFIICVNVILKFLEVFSFASWILAWPSFLSLTLKMAFDHVHVVFMKHVK